MIVVLLYPLLESPTKNHTPSLIFCGAESCAEAPSTRQITDTARNNSRHSNQRPTPRTLLTPKTQRPRVCAASVGISDETLAITATLRSTRARTRSPPTTPIRSLSAGNRRNCGNPIGAVEVRLFSHLFSIILEIIPILIDVI